MYKLYIESLQNLKKVSFVLSLFPMTYFDQISDQNKSEAREPEGLAKITFGIVTSFLFKRVGN